MLADGSVVDFTSVKGGVTLVIPPQPADRADQVIVLQTKKRERSQ
jgi:hypothetical protein